MSDKEDDDDLVLDEKGCLHCLIWDTVHSWAGDELSPREYRSALQAFAQVLADVITHSSNSGNSKEQTIQTIQIFNAMFNAALRSDDTTHAPEGDQPDDLSPTRVIN